MTQDKEYFEDVARMRRVLERALSGHAEIPDFLKPENQVVSDEVRERSRAALWTLRGRDHEAVREVAPRRVTSDSDREADGDMPELDEARKRVRDLPVNPGEDAGEDDASDGDRRDGAR